MKNMTTKDIEKIVRIAEKMNKALNEAFTSALEMKFAVEDFDCYFSEETRRLAEIVIHHTVSIEDERKTICNQ